MRAEPGPNGRAAITREVGNERSDWNQRSEERSLPGDASHSERAFFFPEILNPREKIGGERANRQRMLDLVPRQS
jgi:hypothetical protein